MRRLERRLMLILDGRLDQDSLVRLRQTLGLTKVGRLTDWEDEQFGYREFGERDGPTMSLELWRTEENQWLISLDVAQGADVGEDVIATWQEQAEVAAQAVGFRIVERRLFPAEPVESYTDINRNENWLRTAYWDLPAQTLDELWSVIGVRASPPDERRAALVAFMDSPTWEPAPERIKREAEEFLR